MCLVGAIAFSSGSGFNQIMANCARVAVVAQFSPNEGKVAIMEIDNLFHIRDNILLHSHYTKN
jgi:hypothetical protein